MNVNSLVKTELTLCQKQYVSIIWATLLPNNRLLISYPSPPAQSLSWSPWSEGRFLQWEEVEVQGARSVVRDFQATVNYQPAWPSPPSPSGHPKLSVRSEMALCLCPELLLWKPWNHDGMSWIYFDEEEREPQRNWYICVITLWTALIWGFSFKMHNIHTLYGFYDTSTVLKMLPVCFETLNINGCYSYLSIFSHYMCSLPKSFQSSPVPTASDPAPIRCVGAWVDPCWSHPTESGWGSPPCRQLGGWHDLLELSLQVLSHL